jgi:D-alanyl-D-alanine carboxypeptidase
MFQRLCSALAPLFLLFTATTYAAEVMPTPAPPIIGAKSYLIIDGQTGHELARLHPPA